MATHVKVIAALNIVFGAGLGLVAALLPLGVSLLTGLISRSGDADAATGATILGFAGIAVTFVLGAFALLYVIAGYGLLKLKPWGRIMGIVVGVIGLLRFPLGTALGVYSLVILFRKDTEALFAK